MAQGSLDKPDTGVVAVAGREEMRQLFCGMKKSTTNLGKDAVNKIEWFKHQRTGEEGRRGSLKV